MKTFLRFSLVLTMIFAMSTGSAREMTPKDSIHRVLDGQDYSSRGPASTGIMADLEKLKNKATKRITDFWNRLQDKLGLDNEESKVAEQKPVTSPEDKKIISEKVATLPVVDQKLEQAEMQTIIDKTQAQVKSTGPTTVVDQGRPGTTALPNTKTGVPVFDLFETKKSTKKDGKVKVVKIKVDLVPRLDIGTEKSIRKNDFIPPDLAKILKTPEKAVALKTPDHLSKQAMESWTKKDIEIVKAWNLLKDGDFGLGKIVTFEKVEKVDVEMKPEKVMEALKALHKIDDNDLKMLTAMILYGRGDKCHVASGLLHELSKTNKYSDEANFYLGVCSHRMGFHSEAVTRLEKVVKSEDKEFAPEALENLVEDLPQEFESDVARVIKGIKDKSIITEKSKDQVNYVLARAAHRRSDWSEAIQAAGRVREKSPLYAKAQYLKGIGQYASRDVRQAEKTLEDLRKWMENGKDDKNLRALIAVNLGRIKFKLGRFEAAYQDYMKVPKDHPLWVEALVEQGWTQLGKGDAPGAIGNMYSLHSPYFKTVFMPDSWVVRTIGYIDICQYGDAYRTLTKLDKMHTGFLSQVKTYLASTKNPSSYYQTVRSYLKGQSDKSVDGLSAQVIRETARQRGFLNIQDSINRVEDELSQYDFIESLVKKDIRDLRSRKSQAIARRNKAKADLAKIATNKELIKFEVQWRASVRAETALISKLDFEIYVFEGARRGFGDMKKVATKRMDKDKAELRIAAGKELRQQLQSISRQLEGIIEGNEFLRYEIFAGSGEDIRYQAAGGKTSATLKIPANVKPQKILNWEFDGEYWEDEIGSYRSTLRNNCPHRTAAVSSANE